MTCPHCQDENIETEMELLESVNDYFDPRDNFGHGQNIHKYWFCNRCRHEEEWLPDDEDYIPPED